MKREWVPINNLPLEQILDLSVVDIIILQHLVKMSEPIIRIDLLEQINNMLNDRSKIAASSFYRKLDKLEEKLMITYVESAESERKRNNAIIATENAIRALRTINQISFFGSINYANIVKRIVADFIKTATITHADNLLLINTEFMIDSEVLQTIGEYVDQTYLIADDDFINRYNAFEDASPIIRTNIFNGAIREPDDFFDVVVIVGYEQAKTSKDAPVTAWLDEAIRVTKRGGILLLTTIAEIPETDHFIVELLKENAQNSLYLHYSTKERIMTDLSGKLSGTTILQSNGMILGYGYK